MKTVIWNGDIALGNFIDDNELTKGDMIKYNGPVCRPLFIERDLFDNEDTDDNVWDCEDFYLDDMEEFGSYSGFDIKIVGERIFSYEDNGDMSCLVGLFYVDCEQKYKAYYAVLPTHY